MTAGSLPDGAPQRPRPRPAGVSDFPVDDLFTLPDLPPHTELIDGSLVFASPQRRFHARMIDVLVAGPRAARPSGLSVERESTVALDRRNGPEPDVVVVSSSADEGLDQTRCAAKDVTLAVEVVSPESAARDRGTEPAKYARAGIPHFWLVERAGSDHHPVVHVYELDAVTDEYALTGIHHDQLKIAVPSTSTSR